MLMDDGELRGSLCRWMTVRPRWGGVGGGLESQRKLVGGVARVAALMGETIPVQISLYLIMLFKKELEEVYNKLCLTVCHQLHALAAAVLLYMISPCSCH